MIHTIVGIHEIAGWITILHSVSRVTVVECVWIDVAIVGWDNITRLGWGSVVGLHKDKTIKEIQIY
jgi:hypothetical protein